MAQTAYNMYTGVGLAGQIADLRPHTIESYAAETAVYAGRGVIKGTDSEKQVKALTATTTDIKGVIIYDGVANADGTLSQYDSVGVMRKGLIWVDIDTDARGGGSGVAIADEGDVYVVFSGSGKVGKFRGDDGDSTTAYASKINGAKFRSSTKTGNIALVEFDLI